MFAGKGGKDTKSSEMKDYELNDEASVTTAASPLNAQSKRARKVTDPFTDTQAVSKLRHVSHAESDSPTPPTHNYNEQSTKVPRPHHNQNWLARFLRIRPATHVLCFQVSKLRARREIASVFREWRQYGMRDILVNKELAMIWARVDAKNCESTAPRSIFRRSIR